MTRLVRSFGLTITALAIATNLGCSAFQRWEAPLTVETSDPKAEIFVDNKSVGFGKVALQVERHKDHTITAVSPSGAKGATTVDRKVSATGVLDIVGACIFIIPVIGIFTPGFWDLQTNRVELLVK